MKNKMTMSILILLLLGVTVIATYADAPYRSSGLLVNYPPLMPEDTSASDTLLIIESTFVITEEEAEFPGGDDAMESYFMNVIKYPSIALEQGIEGKVNVSFTINAEGYVDHVEILEEIGGGCEDVIISALYHMPRWTPKKQAGKYIASKNKFSFTFKL